MIAVFDKVNAAVEYVNAVIVVPISPSDGKPESVIWAGVNARSGGRDLESLLRDLASHQIHYGEVGFVRVRYQQSAGERDVSLALFLMAVFILVAVFIEYIHELDGFRELCERHDGLVVLGGVLDKLFQPTRFQGQTNAEHQVGVRNFSDIPRSGLEDVRVGVGR